MKRSKQNGITLIALVITIVVLLILAAVSIATLTGQNGILTRADDARTQTEQAEEDELRRLTSLEAATNIENTKHTETITQTGTDGTEETKTVTVTIPAGFAVSQVEGENTIEDGLVIIDSTGNEFVWIPINNEKDFINIEGYESGNLQNWLSNNFVSETYSEEGYNIEEEEYNIMKESVLKYNGFYVARYEAGKEDYNGTEIVVSKKGANVWSNIQWGNSMSDIGTEGAVAKSKSMYDSNSSVTSTLIYGVQWDSIMNWIKNIDNPYVDGKKVIEDSSNMGWFNDNYIEGNPDLKTGISGNNNSNSINNIYDLAGNVREWTMESYKSGKTIARIYRGGDAFSNRI